MCTLTGLNNICLFTVLERPIFKKKKKRAISLSTCFSVLCSLAGREKALSFLYVLLLAIICELLDLAQMNHGEAQQFLMYVQQLLFWRCVVCSLVRKSTVC